MNGGAYGRAKPAFDTAEIDLIVNPISSDEEESPDDESPFPECDRHQPRW